MSIIKSRIKILKKIAATHLTNAEIFKLDSTAGAPSGYTSITHLTPKAVAIANSIRLKAKDLNYGYKEYFSDVVDGKTYYFVAKLEPHASALKGVSIYELKEGQSTPEITSKDDKLDTDIINKKLTEKSEKIGPEKGKFLEQYKNLLGQERDNYVVDYVSKYIDQLPMKKLKIEDPKDPSKFIEVEVQPQFFSIEGYPVQVSAAAAEKISKILSAKSGKSYSLPTQEIIRELYSGKAIAVPFKWKSLPNIKDPKQFLEHSSEVAKQLAEIDPEKFVVGPMKEKTLPHENDNLHSLGLLSPVQKEVTDPEGKKITLLQLFNKFNSLSKSDPKYKEYETLVKQHGNEIKLIQSFKGSTGHDKYYADYSEGTRYMGNISIDGETLSFEELKNKAQQDPLAYGSYYDLLTGGKQYSSYLNDKTASINKFNMLARTNILNSIILNKI